MYRLQNYFRLQIIVLIEEDQKGLSGSVTVARDFYSCLFSFILSQLSSPHYVNIHLDIICTHAVFLRSGP